MSVQIREKEANLKLMRFINYLMQLEGAKLNDILHHLPNEFEKEEHETVVYHVKQICELIKKKCNTCFCSS